MRSIIGVGLSLHNRGFPSSGISLLPSQEDLSWLLVGEPHHQRTRDVDREPCVSLGHVPFVVVMRVPSRGAVSVQPISEGLEERPVLGGDDARLLRGIQLVREAVPVHAERPEELLYGGPRISDRRVRVVLGESVDRRLERR